MSRVVVSGYIIRHPTAGVLYTYYQYILGLLKLGYDVVYLEESGWTNSCYDPTTWTYGDDPRRGIRMLRQENKDRGVTFPVFYVNRDSRKVYGGTTQEVTAAVSAADLLLNLGGVCWLPEFELAGRLALVDMDPFFTQVGRFATEAIDAYDAYFTYGLNIGQPDSHIPTLDKTWLTTVPPVEMGLWSSREGELLDDSGRRRFTTIANWSAYGSVTWSGREYGQKDHEFLRHIGLASDVSEHAKLEIALSGAPSSTRNLFMDEGWRIMEADDVTTNPSDYRTYIRQSSGEFSVAKHGYVLARTGWFSERSANYLAAGRPVVVQDTGFHRWLSTGDGLMVFNNQAEAHAAIEEVCENYSAHCQGAREVARTHFDSDVVLPRLLDRALSY